MLETVSVSIVGMPSRWMGDVACNPYRGWQEVFLCRMR
jgi:hypothetical protein